MSNLLEWFIPPIFVGLCFQALFCYTVNWFRVVQINNWSCIMLGGL